jgi:hypothetical protein
MRWFVDHGGHEGQRHPEDEAAQTLPDRDRGRVERAFQLRVRRDEPGARTRETFLWGEVVDQSHLHGILARIQDLGLELVSVTEVPEESSPLSKTPSEEEKG